MTLVNELGLTAHLGYIGRTRGQSYFHGHDYSLVLDTRGLVPGNERGQRLVQLMMLLKSLGLPALIQCDEDQKSVWQKIAGTSDESTSGKFEPPWFTLGNSLRLAHIYGGQESNFGKGWTADSFFNPERLGIAGIKGKTVDDRDLLGIYQIKLNPKLAMCDYPRFKTLVYLAIVHEINEQITRLEQKMGLEVLPSFIRPLVTSSYFEVCVLVRCQHMAIIEEVMHPVKRLCMWRAKKLLGQALWQETSGPLLSDEQADGNASLFSLTHTTFGLACHISNSALNGINRDTDDAGIMNHLRKHYAYYRPDQNFNPRPFQLMTSGMVSAKLKNLDDVATAAVTTEKVFGNGIFSSPPQICGRHDFQLFLDKTCTLDEYFAKLQFLRHLVEDKKIEPDGESIIHSLRANLTFHMEPNADAPLDPVRKASISRKGILDPQYIEGLLADMEKKAKRKKINGLIRSRESWNSCNQVPGSERFRAFLDERFDLSVSNETRAMFFSTLCAIDSFLSDSFLYYLFVDVCSVWS